MRSLGMWRHNRLGEGFQSSKSCSFETFIIRFESTVVKIEELKSQVTQYIGGINNHMKSFESLGLLPEIGEPFIQVQEALVATRLHDVLDKAITEHLEAPMNAMMLHLDETAEMARNRQNLVLDYTHHRHKFQALEEKLSRCTDPQKKIVLTDEKSNRTTKLNKSIDTLKEMTANLIIHFDAIEYSYPRLKKRVGGAIFVIQRYFARVQLEELRGVNMANEEGVISLAAGLDRDLELIDGGGILPPPELMVEFEDFAYARDSAQGGTSGAVFGRRLEDMDTDDVPLFFLQGIAFLDSNALYTQGLFRVPGSEDTLSNYKRSLDSEQFGGFPEGSAVADVASLIKLFIRQLPEPLIPSSIFTDLLAIRVGGEDFSQQVRDLLYSDRTPPIHRETLRILFGFLTRVEQCHEHNMMSADNLAIVFAPTLLRPPGAEEVGMMDLQGCIAFIRHMCTHSEEIFPFLWDNYPAVGTPAAEELAQRTTARMQEVTMALQRQKSTTPPPSSDEPQPDSSFTSNPPPSAPVPVTIQSNGSPPQSTSNPFQSSTEDEESKVMVDHPTSKTPPPVPISAPHHQNTSSVSSVSSVSSIVESNITTTTTTNGDNGEEVNRGSNNPFEAPPPAR